MNRATALLLAMATLLAHALAVHRDEDGSFGQPYEVAHEAYHLGRNLVREGSLAWNPTAVEADERGGLGAERLADSLPQADSLDGRRGHPHRRQFPRLHRLR